MTFLEALQVICDDRTKWAAPKGSKGYGIRLNEDGNFDEVPSDHGGMPAMLPRPKQLFGDWVVLSPNEILS